LLTNNPTIEKGTAFWSYYSVPGTPGFPYTNVSIVDRDTEATYFLNAPLQPVYLTLDGAFIPDPIPAAGRYYSGKHFQLSIDSPVPGRNHIVYYRFISVPPKSMEPYTFEPEEIDKP
jgi:hypothetical protein